MIVGEAFQRAMNNRKIPVTKVSYQDMGNWVFKENKLSCFHCHIFGRVLNAPKQPFPESVYLPDRSTGFYDDFKPLNKEDIKEIRKQIKVISDQEKYLKQNWRL
jgi:hypothetical protein